MLLGFLRPAPLPPRLQALKQTNLFGSLSPLELRIVGELLHERRYLGEEVIFDEGEEGQALYLIQSGRVSISRANGGQREVVTELGPGNFFGDLALLDNAPRNAQARALDGCELAVFFRDDFLGLMKTDAEIGYKIAIALARHIGHRLRDWMGGVAQHEAL